MTLGTDEERKRINNRLRRAHGQLGAVITAMETGADCRAIVTQLAAVSSALDRAGFAIISTTMQDCLAAPEGKNAKDGTTPEELEKLFMMLA